MLIIRMGTYGLYKIRKVDEMRCMSFDQTSMQTAPYAILLKGWLKGFKRTSFAVVQLKVLLEVVQTLELLSEFT